MTEDFDLVTIGAGSGGVAASRRAAALGARVAIVEGSRVGGTCVIRGCVPKKLLMYAGAYGDALREAEGYGWQIDGTPRFEMLRWAARKAAEIDRLEGIYRRLLADSKVELVEGHGRLDGPNRVVVRQAGGEQRLSARRVLIATGAAPVRDSVPGIETCPTSDELLDLQALPARVGIVGAGYIAVEFASMLARLGVEVHLFFRAEAPLRGFDDDLRHHCAAALAAAGVRLHPGVTMERIERLDAGGAEVGAAAPAGEPLAPGSGWRLRLANGEAHDFPWLLNASGRRPNTANLGLETLGLATGRGGELPVDDRLQTGTPGVYAIGDVTDRLNLTPVAIAEGRALVEALFGDRVRTLDLDRVASAVFTLPPLASIGPTEAEAAARAEREGRRVSVYEADFRPMRQAFIDGLERSYMKLLVDTASGRVLAVHMAGADAPEIVQSLAVALTAGATKADFDRTVAVHPTAAEEFVLMREASREAKRELGEPA